MSSWGTQTTHKNIREGLITDPVPYHRSLIISYYWPPCGGPGSLRPVKFVKYLPQHEINPVVLTRKPIAYHTMDHGLQHETGDVPVIKTESLDPARMLYVAGMRSYKPRPWQRPIKQGLNFPDHKILWYPFAYQAARRLAYDSIYVTAPPFSAFLIGYSLAYESKKPLILDYRDSWLHFPFMPYRGLLQRSFVRFWERKITRAADAIIVVDHNIKNDLVQRYPDITERVTVLPNGYDPDDFLHTTRPGTFTLTYLGTVRKERDPDTILRAAEQAITTYRIEDLRFNFIGHIEDSFRVTMKRYPFVRMLGHLPHKKALQTFSASHCGIMITTGSSYFFPSRQNEYLASGLPILVCGESEGIHLLEDAFSTGYPGWIHRYSDINGMAQRIGELYTAFKAGTLPQGKTPYTHLTRQNLTKQLATIIKNVIRN